MLQGAFNYEGDTVITGSKDRSMSQLLGACRTTPAASGRITFSPRRKKRISAALTFLKKSLEISFEFI